MVPHITNELWKDLGDGSDLTTAGWPSFDPAQIDADDVEYPIQVNGKMRGKISLPRTLTGPALDQAVLAHPDVVAIIAGKPVKKLVVVPNKIVNLVLG
jgi:leucyl-tRNA synthetase